MSLAATVAFALSALAPVPENSAAAQQAVVQPAQIVFLEEVKLPAEETGRLVELLVSIGQRVEPDTLLGRIDDRKHQLAKARAELEREAALARASEKIEVEYALASHKLAESELKRDMEINRRAPGTVPESDIQHKRLAAHRARLQIEKSKLDLRIAQLTAEVHETAVLGADETIARCQLVSPLDGMVVDVLRQQNEWVNAGDPVLHLARMDRLGVEGLVDAGEFDAFEMADRPVMVEVTLARGRKLQLPGKVVHVSPQVRAGNKYRVRAEVENRLVGGHWIIRPGLPASMTIEIR